jgi:hypothetical protein
MVQHFHGQLSGLSIEQKEELPRSVSCIQDCTQYLDMPDVQTQIGVVRRFKLLTKSFYFIFIISELC